MKDAKSTEKPKLNDRASAELRVAAINCNPALDAEDRLRRLLSLLLRHAARDRRAEAVRRSLPEAFPNDDEGDA